MKSIEPESNSELATKRQFNQIRQDDSLEGDSQQTRDTGAQNIHQQLRAKQSP